MKHVHIFTMYVLLIAILVLVLIGVAIKQETNTPIKFTDSRDSIEHALTVLNCPKEHVGAYAAAIEYNCVYFKTNWLWVVAMITQESNWDPASKSFVATKFPGDERMEHALGLMQIKPSTDREIATELGEKDYKSTRLYDGVYNIRHGIYYLSKRVLSQGHDIERGIRAYNAGDHGLTLGLDSDKHFDRVQEYYKKACQSLKS